MYERGLVHRAPWRAREVRFDDVTHVDWVRDSLGEHVHLELEDRRELRLASVADAARLASLVRAACARRSPGPPPRALV